MATNNPRNRSLTERLNQAASVVRDQQRQITDLTTRISAQEKQIELAFKQMEDFTKLLRDMSSSIQRAAQGNYRSLDQRIAKLENEDRDQNTDDTGTAI